MERYILKGHETVSCPDLLKWGKWLETVDRHVADTKHGDVRVSTVFLGLDHAFGGGSPILFETIVFDGSGDDQMERYHTWDEAEEGHRRMCEKVFPVTA